MPTVQIYAPGTKVAQHPPITYKGIGLMVFIGTVLGKLAGAVLLYGWGLQ